MLALIMQAGAQVPLLKWLLLMTTVNLVVALKSKSLRFAFKDLKDYTACSQV